MSIWSIDAQTVTHSIQLAVAPVFFLTAVAGMIGSVLKVRIARTFGESKLCQRTANRENLAPFRRPFHWQVH